MAYLIRIQQQRQEKFIMIIDEWDAICREFSPHTKPMDEYVDFLHRLFKGNCSKEVFAGAYMTGILPIKKYTTESALNNFREYSVVIPGPMAPYFCFVIKSKDDVLTVLIHLGYLSYNSATQQCFIPNKEIRTVMVKAVKDCHWNHLNEALNASKQLLRPKRLPYPA